jgi:NADH-quinone oxidoreductase subunit L
MEKLLHHLDYTLPIILFLLTSIAYSAFLGKFLSLNFLKGKEKEILLHREILMPFSYMLMCLTLIPLTAYVIRHGDLSSLIVGIILALSYVVGVIKPTWESKIGKVLNDRLYLMALNDLIVPGFGKLLVAISYYLDKAVDLFAHSVIPEMFENISNAIRSVQRRRITRYVEFVIALIFFILLLAGWFEWRS